DDELPAHARDRLLTGTIDLGHGDDVCRGEHGSELTGEMARAREEMRLEEDEDAAALPTLADGRDRGLDLGRMVRIVVEQGDTAHLAALFQTASRTGERGDVRGCVIRRDADELERGERGRGVAPVVLARDGEL